MQLSDKQRDMLRLIGQGISQASARKAVGVSNGTWYNWRKNPEFEVLVDTAIKDGDGWVPPDDIETSDSLEDVKLKEFLKIYIDNGGQFQLAAAAVGSRDDIIITYMTPGCPNYDEQFHRLMNSTKPLLERRVLDALMENINERKHGHTADAKWLLERWRPEEFGKRETVIHEDSEKRISAEERDKIISAMLKGENVLAPFVEVIHAKELVK